MVPFVHFYDQDFVDMYDRSWVWIDELWKSGTEANGFAGSYLSYPGQETFNQYLNCLSSLFLVYSNQNNSPFPMVDYFYSKQEESGAIRGEYSLEDGRPVFSANNPEGISPPLFAYIEHGFYHKIGNKKRLKDVVPILERHYSWIQATFQKPNGLFSVPIRRAGGTSTVGMSTTRWTSTPCLPSTPSIYQPSGTSSSDKELSFRYKQSTSLSRRGSTR